MAKLNVLKMVRVCMGVGTEDTVRLAEQHGCARKTQTGGCDGRRLDTHIKHQFFNYFCKCGFGVWLAISQLSTRILPVKVNI